MDDEDVDEDVEVVVRVDEVEDILLEDEDVDMVEWIDEDVDEVVDVDAELLLLVVLLRVVTLLLIVVPHSPRVEQTSRTNVLMIVGILANVARSEIHIEK